MRKMNPPPSAKSILRLSAEEQAILQDEQNQTLQEVQNDGEEIDRLVDTNTGLDDTVLIVSETPEFGVVDRGLVDLVADTAAAGTDADPEQIVATTEDGLATESFVTNAMERLKKLWEKIREHLNNTWKSLVNYLSSEKRQLENVHKQAIEVEKFVEENQSILTVEQVAQNVKDKLANHQFQFHGDLSLISTMSGVPKDFEKQVINLSSYAQDLHLTIGKTLRNMCHEFEVVLSKFDGGKGQHEVPNLVGRFHKDFEVIGRSIGEIKDHDGMLRAHSKGPLLGHFDVELVDYKKDGESDPVRMLIDVSKAIMEVSHGGEKRQGEVPMPEEPMTPALANTIKRWTEFQLSGDAVNVENDLKEYGEKFTAKIDHLMQAQEHVKVLEDEHNTYQIINGLISVCRMLDKMIIEFTLKYTTAVRLIMQNALRYQLQAAEERIRIHKEATASL